MSTGSFSTGMALVAESDYLMSAPTQLAALLERFGLQILDAFEPLSKFKTGIWIRPSSMRFAAVQRFIELMKSITLV